MRKAVLRKRIEMIKLNATELLLSTMPEVILNSLAAKGLCRF